MSVDKEGRDATGGVFYNRASKSVGEGLLQLGKAIGVSFGVSWVFCLLRQGAQCCAGFSHGTLVNTGDFRCAALSCLAVQNGLGGINSAVSYRLDHAPAVKERQLGFLRQKGGALRCGFHFTSGSASATLNLNILLGLNQASSSVCCGIRRSAHGSAPRGDQPASKSPTIADWFGDSFYHKKRRSFVRPRLDKLNASASIGFPFCSGR